MIDWDKYEVKEGGLNVDRTWPEKGEFLAPSDCIEGRYVEKVESIGKFSSNVYVLEVGTARVGVWGSTTLDTKMRNVAIGKMVAIEYIGDKVPKSGGKPYKDFKVGQGILTPGDEGAFSYE